MRIVFVGDSLTAGVPGVSYLQVLAEQTPGHELERCGRPGDSVASIASRLSNFESDFPADLAFVWLGVNDVWPHVSPTFPPLRSLLGQTWAHDTEAFSRDYRAILEWLSARARRVVAVSPLSIGESANEWNARLGVLCDVIAGLAAGHDNVEYLDLRGRLGLPRPDAEGYVPSSAATVMADTLLRRTAEAADAVADERGLLYTIDGVHLSGRGARAVAAVFGEVIARLAPAIADDASAGVG